MTTPYALDPKPSSPHFTIIFTGRSGCGKGTQAKLFIERLKVLGHAEDKILYMETGNRFRAFIESKNMAAARAKEIMVAGGLQPAFLAVTMWSNIFIEELRPEHEHLILDGTPRGLDEAKILDQALRFFDRANPMVVNVNVSPEWSRERMLGRKRADDARPGDIEKRQAWFEKDVAPAIEWYRTNPDYTFIEVNGEQSVEAVEADILTKLGLS